MDVAQAIGFKGCRRGRWGHGDSATSSHGPGRVISRGAVEGHDARERAEGTSWKLAPEL